MTSVSSIYPAYQIYGDWQAAMASTCGCVFLPGSTTNVSDLFEAPYRRPIVGRQDPFPATFLTTTVMPSPPSGRPIVSVPNRRQGSMVRPMSVPDRRARAAALRPPSSRSTDRVGASQPEFERDRPQGPIKRAVASHQLRARFAQPRLCQAICPKVHRGETRDLRRFSRSGAARLNDRIRPAAPSIQNLMAKGERERPREPSLRRLCAAGAQVRAGLHSFLNRARTAVSGR